MKKILIIFLALIFALALSLTSCEMLDEATNEDGIIELEDGTKIDTENQIIEGDQFGEGENDEEKLPEDDEKEEEK